MWHPRGRRGGGEGGRKRTSLVSRRKASPRRSWFAALSSSSFHKTNGSGNASKRQCLACLAAALSFTRRKAVETQAKGSVLYLSNSSNVVRNDSYETVAAPAGRGPCPGGLGPCCPKKSTEASFSETNAPASHPDPINMYI